MSDEASARIGPDLDRTALVMADRRGSHRLLVGRRDRSLRLHGRVDGRQGRVSPRAGHRSGAATPQSFARRGQRASSSRRHGDDPGVFADGETRSFASHIFPIRNPHGEVGVRYAGAYQEAPPRGVLVSSSTANWYQRVSDIPAHSGTPVTTRFVADAAAHLLATTCRSGKSLGRTSTRSTGVASVPRNHSFPHSCQNPALCTA